MPKLLDPIGNILPPEAEVIRHCWIDGLADDAGRTFEVSTHYSTGAPIIKSKQTGRYWVIRWRDLVKIAIANGLEERTQNETPNYDSEELFI